ncbi:hypothetical protein FG386_001121 [Cryptosporidium ryanae]|uniref:uncharacterized protein n=1 Tax=Cryptosporidium ryanae TaxID=515981 RepID=UPI00351A424D|nr:hypothetical protein FG386_001121 [Cryptosporidium ryanae]
MYFKHFENAKLSAICKYNRLLNIWYSEIFIKLVSIIILLTVNIILLIYSWVNVGSIQRNESTDIPGIFVWFFVLIYTGILIDKETLRGLKICFSIILMMNYMLIQNNSLIFSITMDFLNFGVLWCAFRSESSTTEFNEGYTDDYILPLINKDKELLNVYTEVWNKKKVRILRSFNGMFITRYLVITFVFICIFIMKTLDNYTNFDKYSFSSVKNLYSILNLNENMKNELRIGIFKFNKRDELVFILLTLITLIIGLRSFYFDINLIKNSVLNLKKRLCMKIRCKKEKNFEVKTRLKDYSNSIEKVKNKKVESHVFVENFKSSVIFFVIIFLFGLLTGKSKKFDMFSNIISVDDNLIILICIFLPIAGLITEISVLRKWTLYFIFSLSIYNFNLWFDNDIIRVIFSVTSGILFNVSVILFIWNQEKEFKDVNKYPYTHYLLYKIIFFIGNIIGEYLIFSMIFQEIHKKLLYMGINVTTIGIILLHTILNSNLAPESDEIEWEVTY